MPSRREMVLITIGFIAITAAAIFPVSNLAAPALPPSDDALFSTWRLAWIAHQLPRDPLRLFDANIFYPAHSTLAYSDAMLALGVAGAPLIWVGVHPVVVHNLLLLAAFVTCGVSSYLLGRHVTHDRWAPFAGALVFTFAPFRFAHIGHLELQWAPFMPLVLLVLHSGLAERPVRVSRSAIFVGILMALQGLCSIYYFVFFGIYLAAWTGLTLIQSPAVRAPLVRLLAIGAVLCAIVLAPYAAIYLTTRQQLAPRPMAEIHQYSAVPADYLRPSAESKIYTAAAGDAPDERSLFPGVAALALAACGMALSRHRARVTYGVLALLSFDLSLGLNGLTYPLLLRALPALQGLRAPARFGILVLLSLSVLTTLGVVEIVKRVRALPRPLAATVLALVCLVEYWSAPAGSQHAPLTAPAVYRWLGEQRDKVVLELPIPTPSRLWLYETTHEYMSIYHWNRLVNGYSGYAPASYVALLHELETLDAASTINRLRSLDVDYVILHERLYDDPKTFAEALASLSNAPGTRPPQTFDDPVDPAVVIPLAGK